MNSRAEGPADISVLRWRITLIAFYSRCCVLVLQLLSNILLPDFQTDAFITPGMNLSKTTADNLVFVAFGGLSRWDAQHFLHISIFGYVYEHSLAFFPGFPTMITLVGMISKPVLPFLNVFHRHLFAAVCLNVFCFVWTARVLFNLSLRELRDEKLAYLSAIFFSINPACVFFSAVYSETLFSLLSFSGMLYDKLIPCCLLVAFSVSTRSNGILNIGYPVYRTLLRYVNTRKNCVTNSMFTLRVLFIFVVSMSSFILFQIFSYREFCGIFPNHIDREITLFAEYNEYVLRGTGSEGMCNSTIPYFYIQNHYWNVGLFHYFSWKQVLNFLVAFPILTHGYLASFAYLYPRVRMLYYQGLRAVPKLKSHAEIFPYAVHMAVLLIVCFFFVHIQVSTRLLCSSSPLLYWHFAKCLDAEVLNKIDFSMKDVKTLLTSDSRIVQHCLLYCLVGIVLFSNFLPWT